MANKNRISSSKCLTTKTVDCRDLLYSLRSYAVLATTVWAKRSMLWQFSQRRFGQNDPCDGSSRNDDAGRLSANYVTHTATTVWVKRSL